MWARDRRPRLVKRVVGGGGGPASQYSFGAAGFPPPKLFIWSGNVTGYCLILKAFSRFLGHALS